LLRFAGKYSPERLNAACERALEFGAPEYMSVKNILMKELDRIQSEIRTVRKIESYRFAREYGFFNPEHNQN